MPKYKFTVTFHPQEIEIDTDKDFDPEDLADCDIDVNDVDSVGEHLAQMIEDGAWDLEPPEVDAVTGPQKK